MCTPGGKGPSAHAHEDGSLSMARAAAPAYLLSDDAKDVSGTTLYVDAGHHVMGM